MMHIVLIAPKMPANTGNIIRLCANTGAILHLVRPLGFEMCDKKLRRAGLDYHEWARVCVHDDWHACKQSIGADCIVALTTKFSQSLYDRRFETNQRIALVFGSETTGLPCDVRDDIGVDNWLRLPMLPNSRSLNLANSVAITLFEVWRQMGFVGDVGQSVGYGDLLPYH